MTHLQLERLAKALRERAKKIERTLFPSYGLTSSNGGSVHGQDSFAGDIRKRTLIEAYNGFAEEIEKLLEPVDGSFRL